MEKIIEVKNLAKSYGEIKAVKGIDFYVEKGKLFAFLGPNGAGKSTTIDMICTLLKPDNGQAVVDNYLVGKDDEKIRNIIGVVFQDSVLDGLLTVEENLTARASLYGLKGKKLDEAVKRAADLTSINDILKRKYEKLSGGQRRRCDIARALINTPKVLFLDEPTTGLDPQTRKMIWEMISGLQKQTGMTVFLTTHYMEEAALADYVIIIDNGEIAAKGTPLELKEKYSYDRLLLTCLDVDAVIEKLSAVDYKIKGNIVECVIKSTMDSIDLILACKDYIAGFEVVRGSMDDVFIEITGREIRE